MVVMMDFDWGEARVDYWAVAMVVTMDAQMDMS